MPHLLSLHDDGDEDVSSSIAHSNLSSSVLMAYVLVHFTMCASVLRLSNETFSSGTLVTAAESDPSDMVLTSAGAQ